MPAFTRALVDVLLDTEDFFSRPASVPGAVAYFAGISVIALAINWSLLWAGITPAGLIPFEKILGTSDLAYAIPAIYFLVGFAFLAVYALAVSRILRRWKTATPFRQVLATAAYGLTPSVLTLWIPVLGVMLLLWSFYLIAMGLRVGNRASLQTNAKASLLGGGLTAALVAAFLVGLGVVLVAAEGADPGLLWTVLVPL
ncbi:MAG: hypothetical protein HY369_00130 [Candidatus Aenigmarchaeota archaeon]|nr:hypothetical protein [Candidatus Aenigmarchaeota archaeon]